MLSNSLPEHEQTALGIATDMRLLTKPTLETERYLQMHREFLLT
ncbi:hypothetical protein Mal15_65030 [Stieleria maiorica]|uniref:Uncharacterized protein n=2 Tax=Stieleria maiorica TaxID=2795974 RepID=A0A5B9MLW2_9BACT|nr:hypothetical protein Mal15_65030 [Stieleria maiorica]